MRMMTAHSYALISCLSEYGVGVYATIGEAAKRRVSKPVEDRPRPLVPYLKSGFGLSSVHAVDVISLLQQLQTKGAVQ